MSESPQPLISVVMPAYNAEATIGASITGVLTQTYPNVELVVVDDGSTDRTEAICRGYGDLVRYVRQENGGSASARNRGLAEARGELIALCDADDVFAPAYLATMLETYRKAGGGRRIVMTNAVLLTRTGVSHGRELIGRKFPRRSEHRMAMLQKNFVPYITLFPAELAAELGGFATELRYNEDWDFFLRAVLSDWPVEYQRVPLVEYRWTPGAKSTHEAGIQEATRQIMERAGRMPGLTVEEREFLDMRSVLQGARQMDIAAGVALREGRYADARRHYLAVARVNPADRRQALRSLALARVPGALHLWRKRVERIDAAMGREKTDRR